MGNFFSDLFSSKEAGWETPPAATFTAAPEYGESKQARETYGSKLFGWGNEPGYGAISPNWSDIWQKAQDKIKQYYWGGPGGQPGLADKVRASAAGRNVSESPALQTELTNMGYQEAGDIGNLATTMATKEAEFGEAGRSNWMSWLSNLMGQKPSGNWQGSEWKEAEPSGTAGLLGQLGGSLMGSMFGGSGGGGDNDWLNQLLGMGGTAIGTAVGGPVGGMAGGAIGRGLGAVAA